MSEENSSEENSPEENSPEENSSGWLSRLKGGLSRSSEKLTSGTLGLLTRRRLDEGALEDLEELLISIDLGVATAAKVVQGIAKTRFNQEVTDEELRAALADEIIPILEPVAKSISVNPSNKPHVILMAGVNGSGKTTTIGKLAKQLSDQGLSVMIAAGDTFRAAAIEQLQVWGERTGSPVIAGAAGADPAGLVYDALSQAKDRGADVLLVDTAGRLQNKTALMDELKKIIRVMGKLDETAPHDCLLVLDATVGQNAHSQVETFKELVDISGLVLTKLDGSAKGGVVVALAEKFGLPIHAVGVGEGVEDLQPFSARVFARFLLGLDN